MAILAMKLLKVSLDVPVMNAAVVGVRQLTDAAGGFPAAPFEEQLPIPAGPAIAPARYHVPPGRYALTARGPGGGKDQRRIEISEGQTVEVTFDVGHSPREWLSWSTLAGAVPTADEFAARDAARRRRALSDPRLIELFSTRSGPPVLAMDGLTGGAPFRLTTARGRLGFDRIEQSDHAPLAVTGLGADGAIFGWRALGGGDYPRFGERLGQPYVFLEHAGGQSFAVLPLPWPVSFNHELRTPGREAESHAAVDLLLDRTAPPHRAVRTVLREPEFVALLGYLGAGQIQQAAAALGPQGIDAHVTRLIREKIDNPLAAAGAAYVGLATTGDEALRARWTPWLRNLMTWFDDLPDGAILFARDRIERAQGDEDLKMALEALKIAYRRGAPLYTAGFQHLLAGLQLFSDDEADPWFDAEAQAMRRDVARLAAFVDPTQPFTVVTIPPPA